ncbi:GAF and ANTAR domain-containing protein [Aeromicrobium sp. Marseille-Q0843]|uniref:GAF and ANTAR domain-containing protein n=1 Tax=Aeromicrobium phoceense TaxID=2754045 RepID=A0A838XQ13_9ACTN|nr:GAF and ANTAR domain-containing protein [Aeromicrobium phoceense]MBA4609073.1 GAF and ANTAR domain-containing protein [Aeromicrobium phoceense]
MDTSGAAHALARVSAELTDVHNVAGGLVVLLRSCGTFLDTQATGLLIENARGELELLSSSTHGAAELEVLQAQLDEGPCIDAHASGEAVQAAGLEECQRRWPAFGQALEKGGYGSVHASPVRWQGSVIGAMGAFRRSDRAFGDDEQVFSQAFADLAAVMIVSLDEVSGADLRARLDETLASRISIEQAKGVLAERQGLSMEDAYERLLDGAAEAGRPLTEWAGAIIADAQGRS